MFTATMAPLRDRRTSAAPLARRAHTARAFFAMCSACALLLSASLHAAAEAPADYWEPWEDALSVDYRSASLKLEKRYKADPGDLRVAVAHAAALLSRNPITQGNINKARGILETLIADAPQEAEMRPIALFLLGRIYHDHLEPVQLEAARATYEQLRSEYPRHELADQAAVHLGLLLHLQLPETEPEGAAAKFEALIPTVSADHAKRELHSITGHLYWYYNQDAARALPHLIAGRELGYEAFYRNSEQDIMIAGLARELGLGEVAAKHYLRFAEAAPRDTRAYTARRLAREALGEAESDGPPAATTE